MAEIRAMHEREVCQLVDWANQEGWNPGINDAACFWNLDPQGFLALIEDEALIGGGAIIRHSESFGFMGLFIVSKSHRGQGLGTRLWFARRDRLLSRLDTGGTIGLDGVDAMVPFYAKGGFQPFTRHRRYQLATAVPSVQRSAQVVDLRTVSLDAIAELDRRCFPASRRVFLWYWIRQSGAVSLGFMEREQLRGFGVMRPCITGWKIGPLFAESASVADALLQAFLSERGHQPLFLDAPDNNPAAKELCCNYHMQEVFGCVRMYLGPVPALDHACIFGITTLEVG